MSRLGLHVDDPVDPHLGQGETDGLAFHGAGQLDGPTLGIVAGQSCSLGIAWQAKGPPHRVG